MDGSATAKVPNFRTTSSETDRPKSEKSEPTLSEDNSLTLLKRSDEKLEKLHERIEIEHIAREEEKNLTKKGKSEKTIVEGEKGTGTENISLKKEEREMNMRNENAIENKKISDSVPCCPDARDKVIRNQSDIFSLKGVSTTLQTSIFSVNGSPSRKVFRKQEPAGHVFQRNEEPPSDTTSSLKINRITKENYNDEKRPSSSFRNPLTGSGLSSNDEYKSKGIKRKDGNPLLGLGYDSEVTSGHSQQRIPPGGYSHKLW